MSLVAELSLSDDLILFDETFEHAPEATCVFEDTHYLEDGEGTYYVFFWWVEVPSFEAFEQGLTADPTVETYRCVTRLDSRALYRVRTISFGPDQPLVFPLTRQHDITVFEARRDADGLQLHLRVPDRETLSAFREGALAVAGTATVTRLYDETAVETSLANGVSTPGRTLTARQREVLALALERGYFETPSQVTLATLAAEHDVTPQALSKHIRTGVRKLVAEAVETG